MKHRHLDYPEDTPVTELDAAAIDDILDRGTLKDWRPISIEVQRNPWGKLSETVLRIVNSHEMYGTSLLWRHCIERWRRNDKRD